MHCGGASVELGMVVYPTSHQFSQPIDVVSGVPTSFIGQPMQSQPLPVTHQGIHREPLKEYQPQNFAPQSLQSKPMELFLSQQPIILRACSDTSHLTQAETSENLEPNQSMFGIIIWTSNSQLWLCSTWSFQRKIRIFGLI